MKTLYLFLRFEAPHDDARVETAPRELAALAAPLRVPYLVESLFEGNEPALLHRDAETARRARRRLPAEKNGPRLEAPGSPGEAEELREERLADAAVPRERLSVRPEGERPEIRERPPRDAHRRHDAGESARLARGEPERLEIAERLLKGIEPCVGVEKGRAGDGADETFKLLARGTMFELCLHRFLIAPLMHAGLSGPSSGAPNSGIRAARH